MCKLPDCVLNPASWIDMDARSSDFFQNIIVKKTEKKRIKAIKSQILSVYYSNASESDLLSL